MVKDKGYDKRAQRLRDAGYKLTTVRLAVLAVLGENDSHMTSNDVLDAVERMDPTIGRASVFRTLDLLTRLAIIRPTYIESSARPAYVLLPDGHHHHIICINCGRVIDFENCGLQELSRNLEDQFNVRLSGHLLEFYGICADCIEHQIGGE
ncbi:MAG: Fur family transcriptional regulator [Chloroflexota bacterium]